MKRLLVFAVLTAVITCPAALVYAQSASTSRASSHTVILPAGSEIAIQTNEAIDSKTARVGQTFNAQVAQDAMGRSGEVLIPKGSDATLVIRQVSAGSTTGSPEIALDLNSITVGGRRYTVNTSDIQQGGNEGLGKNRRTAEMVGGGAALGTLLGAIAGGGKGAAIGAASGAAVGGTAQVLTKGKDVKVPAETVLKFKLDRALHLTPAGY